MNQQTAQQEIPQPLYVSLILDESGSMQSCKQAAMRRVTRRREPPSGPPRRRAWR